MAVGVRPWSAGDDDAGDVLFAGDVFAGGRRDYGDCGGVSARGCLWCGRRRARILLASTVLLVRRNTRRYGGYIVHFGIVVLFIGIAGGAFNQSHEQEMSFGDSMTMGPYKLVCQSFTQESNPNYDTEYALLDVYKHGKKITQLAPEKRFYLASQTSSTMVALHSTLASDLYVIYEGQESGYGPADHQGVSESADELDLDRRVDCGDGHAAGAGAEPDAECSGRGRRSGACAG